MPRWLFKLGGGAFAIKGVMSVEDAKRAVDIGASAIMISNHGGRQLDGSTAPFDQLPAIVDAVGGKIEVILDGGVRRGTHVLKALAMGAKACMIGRGYLYALAAGGQPAVEQALAKLREEIKRDMILMGCSSLKELNRSKLHFD
jgi:L-lactate dehydrogenase (cytochrome)